MNQGKSGIRDTAELRRRAEQKLKGKKSEALPQNGPDVLKLIHELEVHQIELEMQNEELRRAYIDLEKSRDKYVDLYDFSPIGYFTVDFSGIILEANLTGAGYLGINRSSVTGTPFSRFIAPDSQRDFYLYIHEVFKSGEKKSSEFTLQGAGRKTFHAILEGIALNESSNQARVAVIDVTDRKKAEKKLHDSYEKLRTLASELILVESRERQNIATALHDNVAQTLASMRMKLQSLQESAEACGLDAPLKEIQELAAQLIRDMRSLMTDLSPPVLYELGFLPAMEWLAEKIASKFNLAVELDSTEIAIPMEREMEILLFQSTRELLMNVAKHAGASNVKMTISTTGKSVRIEVSDDGQGFDVAKYRSQVHSRSHFGLFSIRERLRHFGGRLDIKSEPGQGTRITMSVPLGARE